MATRHNLCTNPALKNGNTGWGGDGTAPVRTDVTGEGFDRQYAARYTSGTFARTPAGAVTPALAYTLSFYRYVGGAAGGGGNTIYIEWTRSAGGPVYDSAGTSWTALTVQRFSITATAPALATTAALIIDGPYATRTIDISQILIEQSGALDTYFDGDTSPGGSWDGADGNSASTFNDTTAVSSADTGAGTDAGSVTATISDGDTAASVEAGTIAATVTAADTASGVESANTGLLPELDGTLTAASILAGTLTVTSTLAGTLTVSGALAGTLA